MAVFDSGVGGLTVLHELLVSLPGEDYLYLGDTARFPYGDAHAGGAARVRARDRRAPARAGRKAARRRLQLGQRGGAGGARAPPRRTGRDVDVIGVVAPAAQLAVVASRTGRIGLLATPATVASGAYERAVARRRPARPPRERRLPGPGADHPGRLPVRRARRRDRPRLLRAAARGRRRHGDPRLDALSARRADAAADARPRRDAGLLRRGRRAQRRARARRRAACSTRARARAATASGAPATSSRSRALGHALPADAARRGRPRGSRAAGVAA